MNRNDLIEKMRHAYVKCSGGSQECMSAALDVAVGELLQPPTDEELDAVEHSWTFGTLPAGIFYHPKDVAQKVRDAACIFNSKRRAQLEKVKTPEERVTHRYDENGCCGVYLDGKPVYAFNTEVHANRYEAGLIAELKEQA